MDLIVYQMMQLQIIHIADGYRVVERLAGTAVIQNAFAVFPQAGVPEQRSDILFLGAVKDGGSHVQAQSVGREAQMNLQHLADVHAGGHAQGVQHNIQRRAVGQEGHILLRQNAGNDALVAVAAGHLIAHGDFPLLCDIAAHHHVDAGAQLVAVGPGEDLHIHNNAAGAVRHPQGGVPHFAGLFAKDGPQQPLFGGQLGFALGRYLAHQDIAGPHLGAHSDNAPFVQVPQGLFAHIGDIPGDVFGSQLGVSRFRLIFLNVDGGIHIVPHQPLVEQHGVFVIVPFPGHKADEGVFAQSDLAQRGGGAVGDDVVLFHPISHADDGLLVDAGTLIGAHKFNEPVGLLPQLVVFNGHIPGGDSGHCAVSQSQRHCARVHRRLIFNAGSHKGRFGLEQRHSLPLHIGAHQRPVGVVVFQEGNHGGGHRDHHFRRNVHQIHPLPLDLDDLVPMAAGHPGGLDAALFVQGLVGLGHDVLVLNVRRHIPDFVRHHAGFLVHHPIGGFDKAVVVDPGIGGHIGNQADVGAFWGLDGAQAAIVAVVNVPDFHVSPIPGKAAGAQGGHTALMGQLGQRVVLVHELRQRRRAEKLLDGRGDRPDIDKALGRHQIQVLDGHALPDHPLHAAEADAELVLQQLAHAAQPPISQVVDIVRRAHAVGQAVQIVDRGQDIVHDDVFGNQVVYAVPYGLQQVFALMLLHQLAQDGKAHSLVDAQLLFFAFHKIAQAHHVVGKNLYFFSFHIHKGCGNAFALQLRRLFPVQGLTGNSQHFAGQRVGGRARQLLAAEPLGDGHFLIEFITPYCGKIVSLRVKKQVVQQRLGAVHCGRLARAQPFVNFNQRVLCGFDSGILVQRGHNALVFAKKLLDFRVCADADGPDQRSDWQLAVFIDAHIKHVVGVGFIFQPGTPIGDNRAAQQRLVGPFVVQAVIHSRRTDDLGHHHPLGAVNDKGAAVGHLGEIPHKDLLLLDLAGFLVAQAHPHFNRRRIGGVPLLAFLHRIFRFFLHGIIQEGQLQIAGVVGDGPHVPKNLPQARVQKPLIRFFLDFNEVGHLEHFLGPRKADPLFSAALDFAILFPVVHLPHSVSCQLAIRQGALH